MSAYAPTVPVSLLAQPVVAEDLGVEVVRFEGRVMGVELGALVEEEGVMVDPLLAAVQPPEHGMVGTAVIELDLKSFPFD